LNFIIVSLWMPLIKFEELSFSFHTTIHQQSNATDVQKTCNPFNKSIPFHIIHTVSKQESSSSFFLIRIDVYVLFFAFLWL
jgi:hypothetical protein